MTQEEERAFVKALSLLSRVDQQIMDSYLDTGECKISKELGIEIERFLGREFTV